MRMTLIVCALICLFLLCACFRKEQTIHNRVANRVMRKTSRELTQRYDMRLAGRSYEMFGGPIRNLRLSFTMNTPLSKAEARALILDCVESFLETMQKDPDGEATFHNWPLTYRNASISLFIQTKDGRDAYYPIPSVVSTYDDKIWYLYYEEEVDHSRQLTKKEEEETIEEAFAIIEQETNSEPPRQVAANRQSDNLSTKQSSISGILRKTIR